MAPVSFDNYIFLYTRLSIRFLSAFVLYDEAFLSAFGSVSYCYHSCIRGVPTFYYLTMYKMQQHA